jgi:tetratricopeptide (TPR) repeat protein
MEYAAGGSLDRIVARRPQQPRWAAGLVHTLALAIDSAHRAGVVHRDLKPANVLIASESEEAAARALGTTSFQGGALLRITDFGLALRTDDTPGVTRTGEVVGTPSYMAPEQAAGHRDQVGPATDVYALGAILYELLVGRAPFVAATGMETLLQVLHHDPLPPCRLQPTIPVDLETICMKCLEKEPRRRYGSAAELAADLDRYLKGEPVRARPISAWSRGVKWVRRNRALAGLAAALVLVVAGSLVTLATLYAQAEQARKRQEELALIAQRDRDEAMRASRDFERANDGAQAIADFFFKDLLGAARPDRPGGRASVTLLEALDRAEAGMAARFQGQPGFEGSVRHALGGAYAAMGQPAKALRQFQRDLELRGAGRSTQERLLKARILGNIGQCQLKLGNLSAAREAFQEAYDLALRLGGAEHPETVGHLGSLAGLALVMGDLAAAEAGFRQVVALLSRHRSDDHPEMLTAKLNLARTLTERGRFSEAEALARQVLALREARLGTTHPDVHECREVIAIVLMRQRRHAELIPWLQATLERDLQALGGDDPRVEDDRLKLAAALADAGQFPAAEELLRSLLERWSPRLPADHPDLAAYRSLLGDVLTCSGRAGAAEPMLREALRSREQVLGKDHTLTAITRGYLGHCLAKLDRYAEAEPLLLAAWETLARSPERAPHRLADLKERLVRLYESWGKPAQAQHWRERALPTPP